MRVTFQTLLTLFLALSTFFLTVKSYFSNLFDVELPFVIISIFMVLLSVYLIISNARYVYKYHRLSKYPEALESLTMAFAHIHSTYAELDEIDFTSLNSNSIELIENKIINSLTLSCNNLVSVFALITGYKCSVSIKIIVKDENPHDSFVHTLTRDSSSEGRNAPDINKYKHRVLDNTDFNRILKSENIGLSDFFLCNYLPFMRIYNNSSFQVYPMKYPKQATSNVFSIIFHGFFRWIHWSLPYKSTLVVPIKPRKFDYINQYPSLGYICVDSKKMGVFKQHFDKYLLNGYADGIYNIMNKLLSIEK